MTETPLPMSQEAEQAVIGAMLIERDAALTALELLAEEDFLIGKHRQLFQVFTALLQANEPLDLVVVVEELKRRKLVAETGGMLYLQECMSYVPTAAAVTHYSGIIRTKALQRRLITLGGDLMTRAQAGEEDLDALVRGMYGSLDTLAGGVKGAATAHTARECAELAVEELRETISDQYVQGIPAPLSSLRAVLLPAKPGQLIILAGRPGMGKSALALEWAWHAAHNYGKRVLYISLEMNHAELGERLLNATGEAPVAKAATFAADQLPSIEEALAPYRQAALSFADLPLHILCPEGAFTPSDLLMYARWQRLRTGLDLVIVDYLGLLHANTKHRSEYEDLSEISRAMKAAATSLRVPLIGVHQLNRMSEDRSPRIPTMAHLKGSGSFEQDANAVVLLYRPGAWVYVDGDWRENFAAEKVYRRPFPPGDAHTTALIVAKQRRGKAGTTFAHFAGERQWFFDAPDDDAEQPAETPYQAMGGTR